MIPITDFLLFQSCVETWGETSQYLMAIEELNELGLVLCHSLRANKPFEIERVTEEITDVRLMLEQIEFMLGITEQDLLEMRRKKIKRLYGLLEDEKKFRDGTL